MALSLVLISRWDPLDRRGIKEGTAINLQNIIVFRFTEGGKDVFNLCFRVMLLENRGLILELMK